MDKSRSPAVLVWTLQEDQEPWRAERRDGSGDAGAGDIQSAPSLRPSLQAGTRQQVRTWQLTSPPGVEGIGALRHPYVPVECAHFHFEGMFPFWASDQITASTIANRSMCFHRDKTP